MKAYIETSVEKELPKEVGSYFTIDEGFRSGIEGVKVKNTNFIGINKRFGSPIHENYKTAYWLREFSLPELMEEAISEYSKLMLTRNRTIPTCNTFINDFLTQKGII